MDPSVYNTVYPPSRSEEEEEDGRHRPHQYMPPSQEGFHHRPNGAPPPFNPYNDPAPYNQRRPGFNEENWNHGSPSSPPLYYPASVTGFGSASGGYGLPSSGFGTGSSGYGSIPGGFDTGSSSFETSSGGTGKALGGFGTGSRGHNPAWAGFDATSASSDGSESLGSLGQASDGVELPEGQLVRISCKANPAFNLAVERHGGVIMVPANQEDEAQLWIKDLSYGFRVKDNYGHPAFTLVNKKTRKLLKHAKEKGQQVLVMDYQPDLRDDDILWSESEDFGDGFKTFRSASDTLLNLTVFEGKKRIRNGSALVLDTWHKGDHQLWKIFPLW